jgi:hypothetical protein
LLERRPELLEAASARRRAANDGEHPLLQLQRTAGNRAVADLALQRDFKAPWQVAKEEEQATFFFSKVAMNVPRSLYKGKTNATFDGVKVERHWEWGLLTDDLAIVFQCGPQRFRFETTKGGGGIFPWGVLDRFGDTGGWVEKDIAAALSAIYHHWDDEKQFHAATRVVIDALEFDVTKYRELEKDFAARQARP